MRHRQPDPHRRGGRLSPGFRVGPPRSDLGGQGLADTQLPLFAALGRADDRARNDEPRFALRPMAARQEVVKDYSHVGLSLRQHPLAFLRHDLARQRVVTCADLMAMPDRQWCSVAGLVLIRQRPGSAKGVMFITLEDETGIANLVLWPKVFEAHRRVILRATMLTAHGRIQRQDGIVHFVAHRIAETCPPPDRR